MTSFLAIASFKSRTSSIHNAISKNVSLLREVLAWIEPSSTSQTKHCAKNGRNQNLMYKKTSSASFEISPNWFLISRFKN